MGVHYDSWRGNIQFYLNRAPLGLAWQGVQAQEIFPLVTSTAAKSEVKLISALSFPNTLQFECFKTLSEILPKSDLLNVYIPPGLRFCLILTVRLLDKCLIGILSATTIGSW